MNAPKFTPGPWALGKGYGLHGVEVVGDEGNRAVCGVIGVDRDSRDPDGRVTGSVPTTDGWANAHLIAAAPELYEAASNASIALRSAGVEPSADSDDPLEQLAAQLDAVLAKEVQP